MPSLWSERKSRWATGRPTSCCSALGCRIWASAPPAAGRARLRAGRTILVSLQEVVQEVVPAGRFFASVVGQPAEDTPSPAQTGLFLLTNTLLLGTLGGLFGGTLLPRLDEAERGALDRGAI